MMATIFLQKKDYYYNCRQSKMIQGCNRLFYYLIHVSL